MKAGKILKNEDTDSSKCSYYVHSKPQFSGSHPQLRLISASLKTHSPSKNLKNPKTTEHPFRTNQSARARGQEGFALVVTLSLMILLTVIAVGLLTLSSISLRASSQGQAMAVARANARLALMLAIGELQKSAGADQRITAAADILPTAKPAAPGRARWTGVWDTSAFNPASPNTKAFVRWLVSDNPSAPADATAAAGLNDVLVFQGKDAASSVKVPKVTVNSGSYAYWVEDEGLKADLGWSEGKFTNNERKQAARLSAAPGPDHGSFEGPFSGKTNYPVTRTIGNPWLGNLDKALSVADMPLVMGATTNQTAWLRDGRHGMTLGSRGVLADSKKGGLRRDLSLAFEMDGDAEAENATRFNKQAGEFVGNGDQLSAPTIASGMPVKERFLHRSHQGASTPFSSSIATPYVAGKSGIIRGPNWWALRDYANLYKRLTGSGGDYTLRARSYFPNSSSGALPIDQLIRPTAENHSMWDFETTDLGYVYRPARANYSPVLLGTTCLFSVLATDYNPATKIANLALGIDPLLYFWNPTNRNLTFDNIAVAMGYAFPGRVTLWVDRAGVKTQYGPKDLREYLLANIPPGTSAGNGLTYLIKGPVTMSPGEVMIVSPEPTDTQSVAVLHGTAVPGYATDNTSGVILKSFPGTGAISMDLSRDADGNYKTKVGFNYTRGDPNGPNPGGMWFFTNTSLPPSGVAPEDLAQAAKLGDQIQGLGYHTLPAGNQVPEYLSPTSDTATPASLVNPLLPAAGLLSADGMGAKQFFGLLTHLAKPAAFGGKLPNPVESFARFNPAPVATISAFWRTCSMNQVYNMVGDTNANSLLNDNGINFSASPRNAFWGLTYESSGSTSVPMINIPSSPLLSLAAFSHANLVNMSEQPFRAVGNSWSDPYVSPTAPYGMVQGIPGSWLTRTAHDTSWLLNDALFDRYYLSGIAPEFSINGGGYSESGSLNKTLTNFFSDDYQSAKASPVLRPYLPSGQTTTKAVADLSADDGYRKTGAYSLIAGAFNVNSTSIPAWTALLRGNRALGVDYAQSGGSDNGSGSPFPSSASPSAPGKGAQSLWSGFSRLSDTQIETLAEKIVTEVKLRGPFMSLSDFVNHRVGTPKTDANYMGALQSAIDAAKINTSVQNGAGGGNPNYSNPILPDPGPVGSRKTTTGIPTDITQADLLLPLAPRLAARSDTFRIRAYGEVRSKDGSQIIAQATCEAVVQRVPEYMDQQTDPANNEPWDEAGDPLNPGPSKLNPINQAFGRRFQMVEFRWMASTEI